MPQTVLCPHADKQMPWNGEFGMIELLIRGGRVIDCSRGVMALCNECTCISEGAEYLVKCALTQCQIPIP